MSRIAAAAHQPHVEPVAEAAPTSGRVTVEVRRNLDLPAQDATALDALIERRPEVGVFLSTAWLSGFFADPPARVEPALAILREGGELRGAAPIAIHHALTHVGVSLLGGGGGSDRVDLLAVRGFEAACSDALLSWLGETFARQNLVLKLRDVPADSPLWGALYRAAAEKTRSLAFQPRELHTHPFLDLTEAWATGTNVVRGWRVPSLDKHRRWLERRGRLRIELLRDPADLSSALDTLARFLHVRWQGGTAGSALDDAWTIRFHRHALPLLLKQRRLWMIRLSVDARPIAVFYGLTAARWRGYYLAGYDREWAGRIRLGQITLAAAIDAALQEGADEFDFLKGADRVKYLWPVRERATLDADVYSNGPGAQLERSARAAREAVVAIGKSARDFWPA